MDGLAELHGAGQLTIQHSGRDLGGPAESGLHAGAARHRFGAIIESLGATPAQIVVERAMSWNANGQVWAAGSDLLATRLR